MAKILEQSYEAQENDLRTKLAEAGLCDVSVFIGEKWADIPGMVSADLHELTAGLEHLGQKEGLDYWRLTQAVETDPWWTSARNGKNKELRAPAYGIGEIVWGRDRLGQPLYIKGVILSEAYHDEDYPPDSREQSWYYFVWGEDKPIHEEDLVNRAGLAKFLIWEELQEIMNNFDPFLDIQDLP